MIRVLADSTHVHSTGSSTRLFVGLTSLFMAACTGENGNAPPICPVSTEPADLPGLPGLPGASGSGGTGATSAASGKLEEVSSFGDNPAGLKMYVYAPTGKTPSAVVLALHGCTQHASDYVNAGWNAIADREGLVIVYGEQTSANNSQQCFRWWDSAQIGRSGEALSLASMVTAAHAKYGTKRAFVTGLSAGGAMTTVMLAAYPSMFEAGSIMSGLPYKCATSQLDAYTCMSGRSHSADEWAALVPKMNSASAPRVSIWQGDADYTVRPSNREELVKQWTKLNGVSEEPGETKTEGKGTHSMHRDANGVVRVESWSISGMGHGIALDPKSGCGTAGAYALDVGVCSTELTASFFLGTSPRSSSSAANGGSSGAASSSGSGDVPCIPSPWH